MSMQPRKTKFRNKFKGHPLRLSKGGHYLSFGAYGLKVDMSTVDLSEGGWKQHRITARQIEAARRVIRRHMKRSGTLWLRVFTDIPMTKKPAETRMGGGKRGSIERWETLVSPGKILFEIDGVDEIVAREAFVLASSKLPVRTTFVKRQDFGQYWFNIHDSKEENCANI